MFISFEGIDGCGKTTQAKRLQSRLEATGQKTLFVREPGGNPMSERVRALLLDPHLEIVPFSEMLLFSAARRQLCEVEIRPALEAGRVVICDRFFDSTLAYQGYGRGVANPDWLHSFQLEVTMGLIPQRTYWIQTPLAIAQSRRGHRMEDRMEAAGQAFFERVNTAYQKMALAEPDRFLILDGTQSIEALHAAIWQDFSSLFTP